MSRPITISEAVNFHATGYTGQSGIANESTSYPWSRGYNDVSYTSNYARFQLNANDTSTDCYIYYTFNINNIPSVATITSVSCSARISRNSRVGSSTIQLYNGTTAKGEAATFSSTSTAGTGVSITNITNTGSWSVSELGNLRFRITGRKTNKNQSGYIYLWGITVTVNYSINGTEYEITASSSVSGVTVTPASQYVLQGENGSVVLNTGSDYVLKDNNVDVTSQISNRAQYTQDYVLANYNSSISQQNTSSANYTNALADTNSTTFAKLYGGTQYFYFYDFAVDVSSIPSNATILSVSVDIKACRFSTYTWEVVLCKNTTEVTGVGITAVTNYSSQSPLESEPKIFTITDNSFNRSELSTLKIKAKPTYNSGNALLYLYGAELTVTYEADGYCYIISNISADHAITVEPIPAGKTSYIKVGGGWSQLNGVYKKVSGSWVEVEDVSTLFSDGTIYTLK